ncbi:uncharacterized protein VTP21DRAFT_8871 [Calcarisporiella thermophila]|uniref:uncharacterized protein n=1 Tax=Calcarisporiella thermophila TaxID=911321 RepID=UPI003742EFA1
MKIVNYFYVFIITGIANFTLIDSQERSRFNLNGEWKFIREDVVGAERVSFRENNTWESVTLPHTWNTLDGERGLGSGYYKGPGWYRRVLDLSNFLGDDKGENLVYYLHFSGSNSITDVYVNGQHLGQHRGGFAAFRFDATKALHREKENFVAVRVDNTINPDIPPLKADFTFFGGLYRDVEMVIANSLHFALRDYGGPGVYATASDVTEHSAELTIIARVENDMNLVKSAQIRVNVLELNGKIFAQFDSPTFHVPPREQIQSNIKTVVQNPHLWNGIQDPYLYQFRVELVLSDGTVVDSITQPLGFRSFSIDAEEGFFLNGRYLNVYGVNFHQDRLDKGWAISNEDHEEDVDIAMEIGSTGVRLAHYQHAQITYDLLDRRGAIVWAEIPLINLVTEATGFNENAIQQLRELIRQNYNHPCVFFWSVANEPRLTTNATDIMQQLAILVHEEDPSRFSTMAHCCRPDDDPIVELTDVHAYNKYFGWYIKEDGSGLGPWATELHMKKPQYRIAVSEYGAGASANHHGYDSEQHPETTGYYHPESWQALVHENNWAAMRTRKFIWGKFIWNLFDFGVSGRDEGETDGRNDKGIVTYDRKIRKDAFFFYKAQWTKKPFIYIANRRFQYRHLPNTKVKIYTNLETVSLFLNGEKKADSVAVPADTRTLIFEEVELNRGENEIQVKGEGAVSDKVVWTFHPHFRINSGARSTMMLSKDGQKVFWDTDHYVQGGTSNITLPAQFPPNNGTLKYPEIYSTYHRGSKFSYRVPVLDGNYSLKLYFFEPNATTLVGERPMNVRVGQETVSVDVIKNSPQRRIYTSSLTVYVKGGWLELTVIATGKLHAVLAGWEAVLKSE